MTKVKFCGIRRIEDIESCNALGPDYVGFVFWKGSRRYVDVKTAETLSSMLDNRIVPVGVFMDQPIGDVIAAAGSGAIRMVQLHGSEDQDYIDEVRDTTGLPVIKAFITKDRERTEDTSKVDCDYRMYDSGAGCGKVSDWSAIACASNPFFLAGGLDHTNVGKAISELRPFAVDTSSGIETEGFKDRLKMERFIEAVRRADSMLTEERT